MSKLDEGSDNVSTLTQIILICAVTFVATIAIAGFAPNLKKK